MKLGLNELSKKELQKIILKMETFLSEEQKQSLQKLVQECKKSEKNVPVQPRMSQEFVNEKMQQIEQWKQQIDEGELYIDIEEYEDYSENYWDSDWIVEYYDNQGIGNKMMFIIDFAKDCVNDGRYQEADTIYQWLWGISVCTYSEYNGEDEPIDLEVIAENGIIHIDMNQLALLTLYASYQNVKKHERAEVIYSYLSYNTFEKLHIEDMFNAGRETLKDAEKFWEDWINLLKTKNGDLEARLLKEALMYCDGIESLVKMADENVAIHPSLYLAVITEYNTMHMYAEIEEIAEKALKNIDENLLIRGKIALNAALASDYLQHKENVMHFCWECFRSNSTVENCLRLFGTEEMARRYGMQAQEIVVNRKNFHQEYCRNDTEHRLNSIGDYEYDTLNFFIGNFEAVKNASKNPKGSLGWSSSYIRIGIRLILLYLYENPIPSKAAIDITDGIVSHIGFTNPKELKDMLLFEKDIIQESSERKVSVFWSYFQRWKKHFPMEQVEKKEYLLWAEKIAYSRTDAIVSGQHRNYYNSVAVLLAMVAEIKEGMGIVGAKKEIFAEYKSKFPRHSSFQKEMKSYFQKV